MAGSLWTTEFFSCPNCGLDYSATREQLSARHSGSFACEICGVEVHAWSGNYDFFDWKIDQPKSPVFGKRWENTQPSGSPPQSHAPSPDDDATLAANGG
jgi:hypothetical protein